ncbi:MAG: ABC transporter substrate-binding protein [Balneola sp.]
MKLRISTIIVVAGLFLACGTSAEVTIIDDSSGILPSENGESQENRTAIQDDFTVLKIGEGNKIRTLDPLFGASSSEFRILSLVYDGLTRLSESGEIQGALAKKWTVSRDSLRYTFTLRDNVFYHSDSRFASGIGRQVTPEDIIVNFERMASILVPDNAADMFSNIQGFNAFHSEQTHIKIPSDRTIKSIEGITSSNDSTLVIQLAKKDNTFLEKLAHPVASIYPKESLPIDKSPISNPIGTGVYYLAQKRDNLLILASNDDHFLNQEIPIRIDVTHGKKESELFQDFAKGELDALVEISAGTILQVTDTTGSIDPNYKSVFTINDSTVYNEVNLFYNPDSENTSLYSFFGNSNRALISFEPALGEVMMNSQQQQDSLVKNTAYIAYTENPDEVFLIDTIAQKLSSEGINVVMSSSYAVTGDVTFSSAYFPNARPTIVWKKPVYVLSKTNISGIKIIHEPWNISFDGVNISINN